MPQPQTNKKICKKTQAHHKLNSLSQQKPHSNPIIMSNHRHATESMSKKKRFLFKGMGCKGTSMPVSTPAIIRSAAQWEDKDARNRNQKKKKKRKPLNNRTSNNVVVDVHADVCCTPPGIGIASDVVPRTTNPAPRFDHRKHSREARRNEDNVFPASLSSGVASRTNHRSAEEIIEMMMSRQNLMRGRILQWRDQHHDWRLNVDDMSYEELLDLSDKIGYVGSGLQEQEIYDCLRKLKHFNYDSASLLVNAHKDFKCTICQEKWRRDDEIGRLECGHHHHIECIKKWLLHKNACPLCKSLVLHK